MKVAYIVVALGILARLAVADDCPAVDDPDCVRSFQCCTYRYCGENWDLRMVKRPSCTPGGWGAPAAPTEHQCKRMQAWLDKENQLLAKYANQKILIEAFQKGWTNLAYHDAVALAAWGAGGSGGAVMSTTNDCKIKNETTGCNWLLSQGLPQLACELARQHEELHVEQCKSSGPPRSVFDVSLREMTAYVLQIGNMERWMNENCRK